MSGPRPVFYILLLIVIIVVGFGTIKQIGQSENKLNSNPAYADFNILFHQDLERTPVGKYDLSQWSKDWRKPDGGRNGAQRTIILDYNSGGRISRGMKWTFPANSYSVTADYGYYWRTPIGATLEECYLSYSIMFKPGFFVAGAGKIPGVQGNPPDANKRPTWKEGFGGSLMFKRANYSDSAVSSPPMPSFYVYHQDQERGVGDSPRWYGYTFDVSTDIWYNITYRIVMNTATATAIGGPDGEKDGIMEGFINGELWGQISDLRLRNITSIGIDKIRMQAFFGGGESSATIRDEWIMIDNVYLWTYSDEYLNNNPSVKRGRQPNATGDTIYTPFDVLFGNNK